jgi:hypothetical protein
MHGGIKVYRGTAAAARNYLDADRSRADDYYLAEGTGVARRFTASPDGGVVELTSLTGEGYKAWVAGLDPDSGEPRGRLRSDGSAVRFVEVILDVRAGFNELVDRVTELNQELSAASRHAGTSTRRIVSHVRAGFPGGSSVTSDVTCWASSSTTRP